MANTQLLLKIVEPALKKEFIKKYNVRELKNIKSLLGTYPDFIGYKRNNEKILVLGEITVSGFYGHNGKNFHLGATRKLADSFLKLFILKNKLAEINIKFNTEYDDVEIYFIYPDKSLFMEALGYRESIFKLGFIKAPVKIKKSTIMIIDEILQKAKNEMINLKHNEKDV